ncbi:putative membrane protein [Escherichia coli 1-182-04_S3_C3]|nr:putative membrane protein [Escherichia coli 1-182-04_S3_C3]EZK07038.1 putative membrane protein [Escherichia coli 1-182-04_S3_C1]
MGLKSSITFVVVPLSAALILTTAVLFCLPGRVAAAHCCAAAP